MAKLSDLKALMASAGANAPEPSASASSPPPASPPSVSSLSAPTAATSRRAVAAAKHGDGDVDLRQAFADVQRLPPANKAAVQRPRPSPIPHHTLADERDVLRASKYGDDPAPQSWDIGQEFEHEQSFVRKGLPSDLLTKLRRGYWSVQAELDLHGMIVAEAHDALSDFVIASRDRRLRCVRVIHGKGLTSPGKEPILKGKVRRWLAHWDEVLAFTEAPQHAGGGGAVIVLLKGS